MAYRKTLGERLFHITKTTSPSLPTLTSQTTFTRQFLTKSDDSDSKGFIRRLLHKTAMGHTSSSMFLGERIREKLKGMNLGRERLRFDGLVFPVKQQPDLKGISVGDAKKLIKLSQVEMLKSKLKAVQKSTVSYPEFLHICVENTNNQDQGLEFAKMLDDSGAVIVLGSVVFLHPQQVTKAIEAIIPISATNPNDPRRKELEQMEKEKLAIDIKAEALVRRELWAGLGFMIFQTAGFMRLTFWELSWDVMEPICFYVTSMYCMGGYAFFLRTSKEPTFEGYFKSRFTVKQKKLMKARNFDEERFNELRRALYPSSLEPPVPSQFERSARTFIGA